MGFGIFGDKNKTFKPQKTYEKGTKRHELHKMAKATLGSGDLMQAVVLPSGEDLNEWLAVNTVDFFNTTNLLYGSITEFCTNQNCPIMSAGPEFEYLWMDGINIKKPVKCTAPEYVDFLMSWIEKLVNDELLFPGSPNTPFPSNFKTEVKNIFKRLFRVYAHIYHSHFSQIQKLGEEAHLNTAFKHFSLFVIEFELVGKKELEPMRDVIMNLTGVHGEKYFAKKK
ncbi:MOB kinase activator [Acrasis kona]|uniref:MOB kinase activator n=1 Tax=Acrasis kona TaxID=1008807 RepID=A0AAW2YNZ4_9EUKA